MLFNTSAPERIPALVRPKGQRRDHIEMSLIFWNRRIFTDLTGGHHAFELRSLRPTTQPVTVIMLMTIAFYNDLAKSLT